MDSYEPAFKNLIASSNQDQPTNSVHEELGKKRHSTSSIRHLVRKDPIGKVIYRDNQLVRQTYDAVAVEAFCHENINEDEIRTRLRDLQWQIRDDTNFDYLALLLSSAVHSKVTVDELILQIREEKEKGFDYTSIHPGMPIRMRGFIRRSGDIARKEMVLCEGKARVKILLQQQHSFQRHISFLVKNPIFVLGLVDVIEHGVIIRAGAVLL